MSSYVNKSNSTNIASGSRLVRSVSMTPEQLQRSLRLRTAPGAPRKPRGYDQMPPNMQNMFPAYQRSVGRTSRSPPRPRVLMNDKSTMTPDTNTSGTTLRRTFSAVPGQGVGGFLPPPNGSIQGLNRIGGPTERTLRFGRARSPTLANVNEVFSPRTDVAVQTLSVMNACDSDGNVNNAQLNQSTIDEGLHTAAKAQSLEELNNLQNSMGGFRYSSQETRDFTSALDALRDTVQDLSRNWEQASFCYDEQVTLDHEDKSVSEITDLLGTDACCGLDVMALCQSPKFTVDRVVPLPASPYTNGIPRMYHMVWNKAPSVKLIVSEATACLMFVHNREDAEGAVELPTEETRQCTGCRDGQPNQMAHSCLGFASAENTQESDDEEEPQPLNRSFTPEPFPLPVVGGTYVRKARDGPQYAWVEPLEGAQKRNEFMQPGHRVVVRKCGSVAVTFESLDGGILTSDMTRYWADVVRSIVTNDMSGSGGKFIYKVELSDFHKHMELVPEKVVAEKPSSSVEQTSGGSMSEEQSRSKLASADALRRAQANATNSNDVSMNDKKRKAVENPEEEEEKEEASTPTKKRKVGRPKGSKNKKKSDVPFVGVVANQKEYFQMNDERQQQEAILTSIQRANGAKRVAATRKRKFTTRDGTSNRHAVVGEINDQGVLSPVNSPSNLCRSLSWDTGDSLAEL